MVYGLIRKKAFRTSALLLVLFCTKIAMANEDTRRTYDGGFFAQFALQTALEMIERIPGFTLQDADQARGLSQGGTNVLLNGRPIVGKG